MGLEVIHLYFNPLLFFLRINFEKIETTVIKLLCGSLIPDSGDAFISNTSVKNNIKKVHKHIGTCSQYDRLFDNLTVKEHIKLHARINGIPSGKIRDTVTNYLDEFDLLDNDNVLAKHMIHGIKQSNTTSCN